MLPDDPTTPLGDLASQDEPTINWPPPPQQGGAGGFAPGTTIAGRYRIVALLGRGGMGAVYRADDLRLGQPVALKFVDLGSGACSVENLYHEVRVARQVSHPNVCRVHDVVEAEGHRFIAMEYVDGEDLASLLRRIGRLPAAKATEIAKEIASGLAAAHDRGVVHRDLKPANVMLDGSGHAHITDFGLASLAGTDDGRIAGTPAYMAPEQVTGEPVTTRSDVYALGLIMHELFTGERVYATASYADRRKQRAIMPRPASASVGEIEPAIDALIVACLSEDPQERPASARAVLAMLPGGDAIDAALAAGETPSPEMVAAAAETGELPWRAVAGLLVAIVAVVLLLAWQSQSYLFTLMRKPPEVLADRAEEIVSRAGERAEANDAVHFFDVDARLWNMRSTIRSEGRLLTRAVLAELRPGIVRFVYRRSPQRMVPRETEDVWLFVFQSGRVKLDDPRLDVPGSAVVILDHHGSLVEYRARPSGKPETVDWRPLIEATGIDLTTLTESKPASTPPVPSDARVAWTARFPEQIEPVRIEVASLNGQPAWLRVVAPWDPAVNPSVSNSLGRVATGVFLDVMLLVTNGLIIAAVFLALRILRKGRSDRAGAFRLSIFYGGLIFLSWMIGSHHAFDREAEAALEFAALGQAVMSGVAMWLTYIALEPGVRRTWPRALVGWARLLAGRFRDPLVGREILFGVAAGTVVLEIMRLIRVVTSWMAGGPMIPAANVSALDPIGIFVANRLIGLQLAMGIVIMVAYFGLLSRMALGRVWSLVVLWGLAAGCSLISPGFSVEMVALALMLFYCGLLSGIATAATLVTLRDAPLTLDPGAWYWPRALTIMLIVVVAALWAARTTLGRGVIPMKNSEPFAGDGWLS